MSVLRFCGLNSEGKCCLPVAIAKSMGKKFARAPATMGAIRNQCWITAFSPSSWLVRGDCHRVYYPQKRFFDQWSNRNVVTFDFPAPQNHNKHHGRDRTGRAKWPGDAARKHAPQPSLPCVRASRAIRQGSDLVGTTKEDGKASKPKQPPLAESLSKAAMK